MIFLENIAFIGEKLGIIRLFKGILSNIDVMDVFKVSLLAPYVMQF